MPEKHYDDWESGGTPIIGAHSLAKHHILRHYVETYIEVLTGDPRVERLTLTLVDGFAGGGIYRVPGSTEPHFGSPIILLRAVPTAEARVNEARQKPVTIHARYVFVEKNPGTAARLRQVLAEHPDEAVVKARPQVEEGDFEDKLDGIIARIKSRGRSHRAIFILDQYGYSDVSLPTIQKIFTALPKAEIFMTLAVGWISAYLSHSYEAQARIQKSMGITGTMNVDDVEQAFLSADDESMRKRLAVQKILCEAFATRAGANFFTPFFIMSRESNRPYWFLHLANNWRANDEVKKLHWRIENHFQHYGGAGLDMILGYDPSRDKYVTGQMDFDFGSSAKERTRASLREDLPRRIREQHASGISVRALFEATTNEMPATKDMLLDEVSELCRRGELEKIGADGQKRHTTTRADLDDIIRPREQRYFAFFRDPRPRSPGGSE
jgi:three-Cys-motif partner protein